MIIEKIRRPAKGGRVTVGCDVRREVGRGGGGTLFVRTEPPHTLEPDPNGFLLGAFIPAWLSGEKRIRIEGAVCPLLVANLSIAARTLRDWYKQLPPSPVIEGDREYRRPGTKSGTFFSGGVDSLATIRTLTKLKPEGHPDRPSAAIVVDAQRHPGITRQESDARFARSLATSRELCGEIGVDVIPIYSNVSVLNPSVGVWVSLYHGAFFAGIGHFVGRDYRLLHLASSFPASELSPHGSHAQLDPYYSSQHVRIVHDGVELSRLQKIRALTDWPAALDHMYVCFSVKSNGENCGMCEKCVRTRLHLLITGKLGEAGAFRRAGLDASDLGRVRIMTHGQHLCYRDAIPELHRLGREDLAAACQVLLDEYARKARQKAPVPGAQRSVEPPPK